MKKSLICLLITTLCLTIPFISAEAETNYTDIVGGAITGVTGETPKEEGDYTGIVGGTVIGGNAGVTGEIPGTGTNENKKDDFEHNCADFAGAIRIVGVLIFYVKIVLPLVIIAKSSIDIGKVVMSGNSGDFPKQAKKMGISLVSAIIIFFLPTLINTVFSFINGFEENRSTDAEVCAACLFEPFDSSCETHIKK